MSDAPQLPNLAAFRRRYVEDNGFEPGTSATADDIEVFTAVIADRAGARPLPHLVVDLLATIGGEGAQPSTMPMIRLLLDSEPTYAEPFRGDWVRIMDGAELFSMDDVLTELDRLDFSPPPEFDLAWVPIANAHGSLVFVHGTHLGIWNHLPVDDEPPEHTRWLHEDVSGLLARLETVVNTEFQLAATSEWSTDIVHSGLRYADGEWSNDQGDSDR